MEGDPDGCQPTDPSVDDPAIWLQDTILSIVDEAKSEIFETLYRGFALLYALWSAELFPLNDQEPRVHCKGVDLTHSRWILARAAIGNDPSDRLIPLDGAQKGAWPTEFILESGASFWDRVDQSLSLDRFSDVLPEDTDDLIKPVLQHERVSTSLNRSVFAMEPLKGLYVAFAIPYQTPPLVRKNLRHLINPETITAHPRDKRSAVEAPVALAIESVARQVVDLKSSTVLVFLTGAHPTLELTALTVRQEKTTLQLEVTAYNSIDPSQIARSLLSFSRKPSSLRLIHPGLGKVAEEVERHLNPHSKVEVIVLGVHAVAVGAMRHGGLLNQQFWLGNEINQLDIKRTAPVSLGVLGTNKAGDWFWKRIIRQGTPLSKVPFPAEFEACTSAAERVALAECPNPEFAQRLWLSRHDWTAGRLRWHEIINHSEPTPTWSMQMSMVQTSRWQWRNLATPIWKIVPAENPDQPASADQTRL